MNPLAFTSSNTEAGVRMFPQLVSSGTASRVFPRFHPGFMLVRKLCAEIDVNAVGHADADTVADVVVDEVTSVVEEELRLVVVLLVTAAVVEVVVEAVPGTH